MARQFLVVSCQPQSCNEWHDNYGNLLRLSVEDLAALHALRKK